MKLQFSVPASYTTIKEEEEEKEEAEEEEEEEEEEEGGDDDDYFNNGGVLGSILSTTHSIKKKVEGTYSYAKRQFGFGGGGGEEEEEEEDVALIRIPASEDHDSFIHDKNVTCVIKGWGCQQKGKCFVVVFFVLFCCCFVCFVVVLFVLLLCCCCVGFVGVVFVLLLCLFVFFNLCLTPKTSKKHSIS